jgi:peptide/nickel transport system permease protein
MAEVTQSGVEGLLEGAAARRRRTKIEFLRHWARQHPTGIVGLVVVLVLAAMAFSAGILGSYDPNDLNAPANLGASSEHYFGTDPVGRDIFTRVLYGARVSLAVGIASVAIGITGGMILGLVSGYVMGWFDMVFQRIVDGKAAIPGILIALVLMAIWGPGAWQVTLAISIGFLSAAVRVTRSIVLRERATVYADAARAIGCSNLRIMFRHVMPNSLAPYLVMVSIFVPAAITSEASLSFLGAGVGPNTPSWGAMLSTAASSYFDSAPMLAIAPGLCITFAVLGFNLLGDSVRDFFDPKLRKG